MDKSLRNTLRIVVTQSRKILEEAIGELLQGQFGIHADGKIEDADSMTHLSEEEQLHREQLLVHLEHIQATGFKPKDAVAQLVREIAFTHLNRLCAYKMMETRHLIREAVSRGVKSNGFIFYVADHAEDEQLWSSGKQDIAYRHFLLWLGETLSEEIGVLFSPHDSASRLFPPYYVLERVLELLNSEELKDVWAEDETIGWVYQYFTPKELRDQARKESQAPRNSYELAFRNQFYTPRYVVQFLTENTLGRTWYEMLQGNTRLKEQCSYMVRRSDEVFLAKGDSPEVEQAQRWLQGEDVPEPDLWPLAHTVNGYLRAGKFGEESSWWMKERLPRLTPDDAKELKTQELLDLLFLFCRYERFNEGMLDSLSREITVIRDNLRERVHAPNRENRSQDELLRAPFFVPYRSQKDPREIHILDPACGSGHFLLYCFDLLETIYEEAYQDPELGPNLQKDYATLADLKKAAPGLILVHNLHGIDIDLRATQIAALALWLRAQRGYQVMNIKSANRPKITRSNIVCAEPMPGEKDMLEDFIRGLRPMILGNLVRTIFEKMQLASEAGSLLKIEEEIREAVLEAKQRWILRPRGEQFALWPEQALAKPAQPSLFEGITNKEFWNGVEARVIDALHQYAHSVSNSRGLARQLFADDVVQGFAFIDICQKRFDVVLMNPPYGKGTEKVNILLQEQFQLSKNDIYAAFVDDGLRRLLPGGFLGALTGRNGFVHSALSEWRKTVLTEHSFTDVADLGAGVLDSAWVETAAYVISAGISTSRSIVFIDLRNNEDKIEPLLLCLQEILQAQGNAQIFLKTSSFFLDIPKSPLIYRATSKIKNLFTEGSRFENEVGRTRLGLRTLQDFQYIRLAWEVHPENIGWKNHWVYLNKGGSFSRFYFDFHLLLNWRENGADLKSLASAKYGSETRIIQAQSFYGLAGLTYPRRSMKGFSVRVLPAGCIFTDKGTSIFLYERSNSLLWLGILNSDLVAACVELQSGSASYEVGYIQRLPSFFLPSLFSEEIIRAVEDVLMLKRDLFTMLETGRYFISPWNMSIPVSLQTLNQQITLLGSKVKSFEQRAIQCTNEKLTDLLGLNSEDEQALNDILAHRDRSLLSHSDSLDDPEVEQDNIALLLEPAKNVLGYAVGTIFGRWDLRIAVNSHCIPKLPDPFEALPACPPGMLIGPHGLPASSGNIASEEWLQARSNATALVVEGAVKPLTIPDHQYPIAVNWDGILVDEADHPHDIIRRVRDVLSVIWKNKAEAIEREACEMIGVKELREYFRKSGNDSFWTDHIKRYSKSRRKAPIYWLLQSAKKNYALWLYYHRLDKDTLFKALTKYVEPKIRLEDSRLEQWRTQLVTAGSEGRDVKQLERQLEQQESLVSELYDFRDKLRRAANLNLEPDLNDGVALNIAPLWELVPWGEAKKCWEELLVGKYEWSSISKQLRSKGVI